MDSFFSRSGISAWDFVRLSVTFVTVLLIFLSLRDRKYTWLNHLGLIGYTVQWFAIVAFPSPLATKLFATLLLVSLLVVEIAITRKRKAEVG